MRASWWLMRDEIPALLGAESGALTTMHALHPARKGPTVEDASWCVHRDA
jgi:hypothetical protein